MNETHDFEARTRSLQEMLRDEDIDVSVLLEPRDQLYFSGIGVRGAVIVPADGSPVHLVQLNVERAREESAIDDVRQSRGIETAATVVAEVVEKSTPTVGIETDVVPVDIAESLREELPNSASVTDVSPAVLELRRRKSASEIGLIERAAEISRETFDAVPDVFEEGLTELELKSKLQFVKRGAGAEDGMWSRAWDQHLDFGTLVSGPNTAVISGHWVT